ncbi:MAG: transporter [Ginsengibacter sp.]
MKYTVTFILYALYEFTTSAYAQSPDSSNQHNNLLHPVPKNEMRAFATDRPDATESPYTVDAGHFQLETDLFKRECSKVAGLKTVTNSYNAVNLKLGITHSMDIQIVAGTWFTSRISEGDITSKKTGFGGLTVKAKQNIWGNDKGKTALALLPFVNVPTASSEKISGGIAIPIAVALAGDWGFGAQVQTDIKGDQEGDKYHLNYLVSAAVTHSLCKNLDFFVEGVATRDNEMKAYEYFLDGGLVYALAKNINLDGGVYYGLKNTSSKTYFFGLSFRI